MTPGPEFFDIQSIRPLVRYVDQEYAVIEMYIATCRHPETEHAPDPEPVDLCVQMTAPDGAVIEDFAMIDLSNPTHVVRFELLSPSRWWPAGMGEQALYDLAVTFIFENEPIAKWKTTIGLTSVRPGRPDIVYYFDDQPILLVNGKECFIQSIVVVEPNDEQHVLPVSGHSLLVVRDHYGPDRLYNAADRAGILLLQSIVVYAEELGDLISQVNRLAGHPSLAGWMVDHQGKADDRIARQVHELDPTRSVFRRSPGCVASISE